MKRRNFFSTLLGGAVATVAVKQVELTPSPEVATRFNELREYINSPPPVSMEACISGRDLMIALNRNGQARNYGN
jgi:hypothetical protein